MGYEKIWRLCLAFMPLFFFSCSSSGVDAFHRQTKGVKKELIETLKKVESLEDLQKNASLLRKLHMQLADLMEKSSKYKNQLLEFEGEDPEKRELSDQLREQMQRILSYEGARGELLAIQKEARLQLDAYSAREKQTHIYLP